MFFRVLGQGVDAGGWSRAGRRPGDRNPMHYNGVSSPRDARSDVFLPVRGHPRGVDAGSVPPGVVGLFMLIYAYLCLFTTAAIIFMLTYAYLCFFMMIYGSLRLLMLIYVYLCLFLIIYDYSRFRNHIYSMA